MNKNSKNKKGSLSIKELSNKFNSSKELSFSYSPGELKKYFPHIAEELNDTNSPLSSLSIMKKDDNPSRSKLDETPGTLKVMQKKKKTIESKRRKIVSNYNKDSELFLPKTEDYLRRCSTLKEAEEIINFQLKLKAISKNKAKYLINLCRKHGIRYFGDKKNNGFYENKYRNIR
ncbi:MAG: DUF2095 family protein [Promethearchaeota archaeon]